MHSLGIDIGGTFTDFTLVDGVSVDVKLDKELTTAENPAVGALRGARRVLGDNDLGFDDVETIIHGTTLVSNTIIERTGAKTGLLTTRGTKDVLEIRRGWRYDIDDWQITYPDPLVPRSRRLELNERLDGDGGVVDPIDRDEVREKVTTLVEDNGVESIAVSLLHAYASDEHERVVRSVVKEEYPDVNVSLSSEVAGIIREYERTSTTAINAYVVPVVREYLAYLEDELRSDGFTGELYLMSSNGGIVGVETAKEEPVRLVGSGPAAGVLASRLVGAEADREQLFAFDMGGTTAKGAIIEDDVIPMTYRTDVAREHRFKEGSGFDLVTPMIELTEIGAGGGSIASVNDVGLTEVGPQSAGADPGPVCYERGGTDPTVTDALLLLGFLDPETFFGGRMELAKGKSERVFREELADPTDQSVTDAAWSAYEIVCENMATAFRQHASSKGIDPRDQSMVATGGAGPAHAYRVAEKVGIDEIICPAGAGVASSMGLMMAPRSYEVTSTNRALLDSLDASDLVEEFKTLLDEARDVLTRSGADDDNLVIETSLDMRHVDQGEEMKVVFPGTDVDAVTPELATERFRETYRARFDRDILDHPIEVINFRVDLRESEGTRTARRFSDAVGVDATEETKSRDAYFGHDHGFVNATVRDWNGLSGGETVSGPAVVESDHTTVVVGPDWNATVKGNQDIWMTER